MRNNSIKTIGRIILSSAALILYFGCASSIDRGSLSKAVDKANDRNEGDRRVKGKVTDDNDEDEGPSLLSSIFFGSADDRSRSSTSPAHGPGSGDSTTLFEITGPQYLGVRIQTSNRFSSNYTNAVGGGVLWINHYIKKRAIEVALQAEVFTTDEKSRLFGSVDRIVDIEVGIHTRRFSTPDFTFMGLYVKFGGDLNFLFWDYRNPVISEISDEQGNLIEIDTIRSDGLFGIDADIGLGWSLVQTQRAKVSFEVLAGGTLFWFKTFEAFSNDRFKPDGYIKAAIEVLFGRGDR
jgi:hypothetical protein